MSSCASGVRSRRWPALAALLLLTFGLRLVLALNTRIIGTDGEYYLWMAEDFSRGDFAAALHNKIGYHPLYSALIAAAGRLVEDPVLAAFGVSVLASTAAAAPLYFLAAGIWSEATALLSGLLYAVHPELLGVGGDTMTEGVFHLLFLSALALLWAAQDRRRLLLALAAGFAAGLAYLTRVEGIYLPAYLTLGTAAAGLGDLWRGRWSNLRGRAARLAVFALGFVALAAPYVWQIHELSGRWHFTMKGAVPLAQVGTEAAPPSAQAPPELRGEERDTSTRIEKWKRRYGRFGGATLAFAKDFYRAGEFLHLPLAVIGWAMARRLLRSARSPAGALGLSLWAAGCLAPIWLSFLGWRNDSDTRYYLLGHILLFPWGAAALQALWSGRPERPPWWRGLTRVVAALSAVAMLGIAGVKVGRERRAEQRLLPLAGRAIRALFPDGVEPRLLATRLKIVYYAGGRELPFAHGSYENDLYVARDLQVPVLAGYRRDFLAADPQWEAKARAGDLELLPFASPESPRAKEILIYRVQGVPIAPAGR